GRAGGTPGHAVHEDGGGGREQAARRRAARVTYDDGRGGEGGRAPRGGREGALQHVSVLVGRDTRVVVQGLGREGTFHAGRMREYGTKVVRSEERRVGKEDVALG